MKRLNVKEATEYLSRYDVTVHNYLTMAQVELIAESMMKGKNFAEEIVIRDKLLIQLATNISEEEAQDYDYIVEIGLMNDIVECILNIDYIEEYIRQKRNVSVAMIAFLETVSKNLDKYGRKLPDSKKLEKMMAEIKEIQIPGFGKKES